jgi:hypothetical protein
MNLAVQFTNNQNFIFCKSIETLEFYFLAAGYTNSRPSDQGENKCSICEEIVIGKKNFRNHRKTHDELVSICDCGKRFLSKAGLKYHTDKNECSATGGVPDLFQCNFCPAKFEFAASLRFHENVHNDPLKLLNDFDKIQQ